MASITCGKCSKTHSSATEVRSCYSANTRKANRPSSSSTRKNSRRELVFPNNPFFQDHLDAELAYSSGGMYNRCQLTQIVISEFLNAGYEDEAMECGNCHTNGAWWRPTVGAVMCINCRSVRVGRTNTETGECEIAWTKGS